MDGKWHISPIILLMRTVRKKREKADSSVTIQVLVNTKSENKETDVNQMINDT